MSLSACSPMSSEIPWQQSTLQRNSLSLTHSGERDKRTIETLKRQVEHLSQLVDGLLDVTRITRTALSLNKEIIKINAIVTDIISDIRPRFAEKGLELLENISPEPIFVNADVLRITQCIANILANALKYTPERGTVRIELKAEDESAVITVRDSGLGIHPQLLGAIFEPYLQGPNVLNEYHNRGLGLGLSIVKNIVDLHGGEIAAESLGMGKGSVFTLRLPMHR